MGEVTAVIGAQWGDEGKGKIVDILAADGEFSVVARGNGGANAGHRLSLGSTMLALHQVPSGIRNPDTFNIIGNGAYLDVVRLVEEIDDITQAGISIDPTRLAISTLAHVVLPHHKALDRLREAGTHAQGSTKSGISFVARDKYARSGLQAHRLSDLNSLEELATDYLQAANDDLCRADLETYDVGAEIGKLLTAASIIAPYLDDTVLLLHQHLMRGENVLAEGAQAAWLDIEHGVYPFGTSSHTTSAGLAVGLGIPPYTIRNVIGVVKATKSRVGNGPFVTEITDSAAAARVRGERGTKDGEYGATTNRDRRVGHLDVPELRRAHIVNGFTRLALNKLDCVPRLVSRANEGIPVAVAYSLDGTRLDIAPNTSDELEKCTPIYEIWPGWDVDISTVREFKDLPSATQGYVERLEDQLGISISMIGVGPDADQTIFR